MTDYTEARFFAISGIGYGKGFTPEEAVENYVKTQLRNYRAKDTIFGTRPKFEAALRTGEIEFDVWKAPEGFIGFVMGMGTQWFRETPEGTEYRDFAAEDKVVQA